MAGMTTNSYKGQKNTLQTACAQHKQEKLEWFCETCSDLICPKCVSSSHKGHNNVQLSEITPMNKIQIKAFINETEENELIQIQRELDSTQDGLHKDMDHFESVVKEVEQRGRKLKEDLDMLLTQKRSQMKLLKDENSRLRHHYKIELERKLGESKEKVKHCKESLQAGTDIEVFDIVNGLHRNTTLPRKPILGTARFILNPPADGSLEQVFGKVMLTQPSWSEESNSKKKGQAPSPYGTLSQNNTVPHYPLLAETSTAPPYDLLSQTCPPPPYDDSPQTSVLPELKSQLNISSVCPTTDGGAWTCYWKGDTVTHLNSQGAVEQTIQIPVVVKDICISPTTRNLWACSDKDNRVMEMTSNTLTCRFNTRDEPKTICVTGEEHILVGTKHRLTEYSADGKIIQSTKGSLFSKTLVCSPQKIAQCPVTGNVAVVDRDRSGEDGQDKPHVVVMNKTLQELYQYGRSQHKGGCGSKLFNPWDVAYDRTGNLVIADGGNRCLHLLSGNGKHLRLLHTDTALAWAVGVGREEEGLWAVFGDRVKLVKYVHV